MSEQNTTMNDKLPEQGNIDSSVSYFERLEFDRSSRVLDVGTRFGSFLFRLRELGYNNLIGIDLDASSISKGRTTYPALRENLHHHSGEALPFAANQFDVVTAFDVIEHVPRAETFLREIRRVLRPEGTFVFQTPNLFINIPKEVIYTKSPTAWRTYHCSLQTLGSLRKLLKKTGFQRIVIEKHEIYTEFNVAQTEQHLGKLGPLLLRILQRFPLAMYPNFWGHARNPPAQLMTPR